MFAATCTACAVYQLLWLELVTELTRTPSGYRLGFLCPRCGAESWLELTTESDAGAEVASPAT